MMRCLGNAPGCLGCCHLARGVNLGVGSIEEKRAMATAEVKLKKPEFTNEPFVDFSKPENRAAMEAALKKVAGEFGRDYPMYIGGEKVTTAEKIKSTNPSHPSQVVGIVQSASAEQARQAIESAHAYFDTWKR